jgi:fibronectin-binding autotransporter adhesin
MHHCRLFTAAALAFALSTAANAQTNGTWTGTSGVDANWSTVTNWAGSVQPTNGGSVVYNSSAAANLTNNNDLLSSISSILVQAVPSAAAVTINGNGFTLGSGGIDMTGGGLTQSLAITLTSGQAITLGTTQSWKLFSQTTAGSAQNLTISNPIQGAVGANLTYGVTNNSTSASSSGTIQLLASNTYAGDTTVGGPNTTYVLGTSSPFGTGTVTQSSQNTAPRYQNTTSGDIHIPNTMIWGSGFMYTAASNGNLILDAPISFQATAATNYNINNVSSQTVTVNNNITMSVVGNTGARTLTLTANPGTIIVNGSILDSSGTLTNLLVKAGTGTARINSTNNNYTGQAQIQNGILEVVDLENFGTPSSLGNPATANGNGSYLLGNSTNTGTLRYVGSGSSTNRFLDLAGGTGGATVDGSGTGPVNFTATSFGTPVSGSKTFTLTGSNTGLNTVAGALTQASGSTVALAKTGTGTWQITSGTHTYSGGSSITAGTLLVNNASGTAGLGTAAATVTGTGTGVGGLGTGGTLGGTGTISNAVTVSSTTAGSAGGAIAPGALNGPGQLTTSGNMFWNPGGRFVFQYDANSQAPVTNNGFLNSTGSLDTSNLIGTGVFDINLKPLTFFPGTPSSQNYTIATFANGTGLAAGPTNIFSFSGATFPGSAAPTATIINNAGSSQSIQITFTPVPEPTSVLAVCGLAGGLGWWRVRRRSAKVRA